MYVTARTAAEIDIPVSSAHALRFEVGYDSVLARQDYTDDASGGSDRPQLPSQRSLGLGVRHSWDHRLLFDDATNPQVVTWLHGKGSVTLLREGTGSPMTFRAVPGRSDQLTSVSGSPGQWRLLSDDGDLFLFEQSPGTKTHPWNTVTKNLHARLRAMHPQSLVGYRFALSYEGDTNPAPPTGSCDFDLPTTGVADCVTARGLLIRIGIEWIEASGTVTPGPSMELKYAPGGLNNREEVRLEKIVAGAFRAESGYTTSTLPVLARFIYDNELGQSAQLRTVDDQRYATGALATKLGFTWATGTNRWQVLTVQEGVINDAGASVLAPVETFTWDPTSGLVATHQSKNISVSTSSTPGASMTWLRNNTIESSSFDAQGNLTFCGNGDCGVGTREYARSSLYDRYYSPGPSFIETKDGIHQYYFYDLLDRLIAKCEVEPTAGVSSCNLAEEGNFNRLTTSGGPVRSARYYYYVGDTGVLRVEAEWTNSSPSTLISFPKDGYGNWFTTQTIYACPTPYTVYSDNGVSNSYRVTVYDRESDDHTSNQPVNALLQGDFALTRVTTMGSVDGSRLAGTCHVMAIDRHGRASRGGGTEQKFHFTSGNWSTVETVYRGYKNFTTTPRRAGLPSSFAVQRTPSSTATADRVVKWRECGTSILYDEEGRLTCLEVPHGTDFVRANEVSSSAGGHKRTWTFTDETGATLLLPTYRTSTAGGRVLETGVVGGNRREHRYNTSSALIAAQLTKVTEILSNGAIFSETVNKYTGGPVSSAGYLSSTTTSATGKVTTEERFAGYDNDGRVGSVTAENGSTDAVTSFSYNAQDLLRVVTEADGQKQEMSYAKGLLTTMERSPSSTSYQLHERRDYDRRGIFDEFLTPGSVSTAKYERDGLDRTVSEIIAGAGIVRSWVYDDIGRVSFVRVRATTDSVGVSRRQERRLYDGLGRVLEVCDKTGDSSPNDACSTPEMTYVYDTKGPFVSTACGTGTFGPGITLSDRYMQGHLGYVEDSEGATAYEYDALGRVRAVARHDGPLSAYAAANVTCVIYEYTPHGAVWKVHYPSSRIATYGYGTDKERASSVSITVDSSSPVTVLSNVVYETNGSIKQLDWSGSASNRRTVTRDNLMRPTSIIDVSGGVTRSNTSYTYDLDGDLTSETDSVAPSMHGTTAPSSVVYSQDARRDIVQFRQYLETAYDVEGRISGTDPYAGGGEPVVYSSTARQQATYFRYNNYSYNTKGEVQTIDDNDTAGVDVSLGHGLFGELKTYSNSTGTWTYAYDHLMRRVRKTPPAASGQYRWRFRYGLGREILEDVASSNPNFDRTEFIYLAGEAVAAVNSSFAFVGSQTLYRLHNDRMGVPRKASTTSGTVVRVVRMNEDGEGATVNITTPGPRMGRRYAGQYWDEESGIINNGYRSVLNGRFTSPDPLHMQTQLSHLGPAVYTYAANRPQMYQDPDGRFAPALLALCAFGGCEAVVLAAEVTLAIGAGAVVGILAGELSEMTLNAPSTVIPSMPTPPSMSPAAAAAAAAAAATAAEMCLSGSSRKIRCEAQYKSDMDTCRFWTSTSGDWGRCAKQAMDRYVQCLRGRWVPPLFPE